MLNNKVYTIRLDNAIVARYGCALKSDAEQEFARLSTLCEGTSSSVTLTLETR